MLIEKDIESHKNLPDYEEEEESREKDLFFNIIVQNLENALDGGKIYLCGYDFSLADMAFFNELMNTLEIIEQNIDYKRYPNVDKWMKRVEDIGQIRLSTIKLQEELKKLTEMFKKE